MTFRIDRLEGILKARGISKMSFLAQTKQNKNNYSNWKKGIQPSSSAIQVMADYLKINPEYLTGESDSQYSESGSVVLTDEERELIRRYRELSNDSQVVVKSVIIQEGRIKNV